MSYALLLIPSLFGVNLLIRGKKSFLISAGVIAFFLFTGLVSGKMGESSLFFLSTSLVLFSLPFLTNGFERMSQGLSREIEESLFHLDFSRRELERKLAEINKTITNLEKDNLTMLELYEITKAMSALLSFEGICRFLHKNLGKKFSFLRGFLILLRGDDVFIIDKIYDVSSSAEEGIKEAYLPQREYYKLIEKIYPQGGDFYFRSEDERLKHLYEIEIKIPFALSALRAGNKIIGFLLLEGLLEEDFPKFSIFSTQLSLGLRKVTLYETIEKLATTDSLTGLYVRGKIMELLEEELDRAKRHRLPFTFLMLDIDHFKECNDRYGHLTGDYVLREISRLLKTNLREIDLVGRYGGEELSILLLSTRKEEAKIVAERIREAIEKYSFQAYGEKFQVTVSLGGAVFPEDGETVIQLISRADEALYSAKNRGRNCVVFYGEIK
ncbi:MAG: GGDEF domain-containing protein [Candidatus Omnitrophica bacterium]|nr:GGDEF domain-containing protein [Candidatus Omnitrophota bacterium]MCM8797871.1 GGDEF domain-containing protein [Candidatus Omnitrophota bacterium]